MPKKVEKLPVIAVVGVGAVGVQMVRELLFLGIKKIQIKLLARSARFITIDGKKYEVCAVAPEEFDGVAVALFAGTEGDKGAAVTYAEEAIRRGCLVIDNGADFRMRDNVPLVIPEINAHVLNPEHRLIANPNCSTIIALMPLAPLHFVVGIRRIIATTFQAVSGAGNDGIAELERQLGNYLYGEPMVSQTFPHKIFGNIIPQIGGFTPDGETGEEVKMRRETQKILSDLSIQVSARCNRVPVWNGHCIDILVQFKEKITCEQVVNILSNAPGVRVVDDPELGLYPQPIDVSGIDLVHVGRIHSDPILPNAFRMFIAGDNIRKGAAQNAVQIMKYVLNL